MRLSDLTPQLLIHAVRSFLRHRLIDWSAALTFYAAISLIPALVILIGVVGLIGEEATSEITENLLTREPGPAREIALDAVEAIDTSAHSAGLTLLVGIGGALWSASAYVGGFLRAQQVIHERPEPYPFWRLRPLQIALTAGAILSIAAIATLVVLTGPLAEEAAALIGAEKAFADVWDLLKWPIIVVTVMTIFAVLYWAGPDTRELGFRWLTPGGVIATAVWALGSAGYAFYVASFGNYNELYGSLGALIGFLAWLWLSNMAMLYGAELNSLTERRKPVAS